MHPICLEPISPITIPKYSYLTLILLITQRYVSGCQDTNLLASVFRSRTKTNQRYKKSPFNAIFCFFILFLEDVKEAKLFLLIIFTYFTSSDGAEAKNWEMKNGQCLFRQSLLLNFCWEFCSCDLYAVLASCLWTVII